ncbi:hypothetical protein P9112_001266 [Eukaryota sp. TZLM1-RC]
MKRHIDVTSSRRKQRKAHFQAPSGERRILMSAALSKELRDKHGIRSLPIRRDDEVKVVRGTHKNHEGKITEVFRKKFVIKISGLNREKANGNTVAIPVDASNVMLTRLKMTKNRESTIEAKAAGRKQHSEQEAMVQ